VEETDLGLDGRLPRVPHPARHDRGDWRPGDGVFHAAAIASYSTRLADRLSALFDRDRFPVVLGGECSNLLGPTLALRRRGRYGVVYLDGHSEFRHPGNSRSVGAAGGEAFALVTGRGQADLTDLQALDPYVRDPDAVLLGIREDDEHGGEVRRGSRCGPPGRSFRTPPPPRTWCSPLSAGTTWTASGCIWTSTSWTRR
jgi:arginase